MAGNTNSVGHGDQSFPTMMNTGQLLRLWCILPDISAGSYSNLLTTLFNLVPQAGDLLLNWHNKVSKMATTVTVSTLQKESWTGLRMAKGMKDRGRERERERESIQNWQEVCLLAARGKMIANRLAVLCQRTLKTGKRLG